jgi:hypothetical protein
VTIDKEAESYEDNAEGDKEEEDGKGGMLNDAEGSLLLLLMKSS